MLIESIKLFEFYKIATDQKKLFLHAKYIKFLDGKDPFSKIIPDKCNRTVAATTIEPVDSSEEHYAGYIYYNLDSDKLLQV